ncbi:MAG TPA: hypothetical protein VF746_15800 [Longimicrobium sp.]
MRIVPPTVALAIFAAACAPAEEGGEAARPDSAAAAAVPAPDSGPSFVPSSPKLPEAWQLSERGIGPVGVGMTAEEVRRRLGGDFQVQPPDEPGGCTYGLSRALPPGVGVMLQGDRVVRVEVDSGAAATAAGARIGDTEARLRELYGEVRVEPHKYEAGHYVIVLPRAPVDTLRRIVFETDSAGRVTRFRGGVYPPVEYVEGCS